MKKSIIAAVLFFLFLIVDVAGSLFYQPFHVRTKLAASQMEPRMYVWDGVLLMLALYLAVLLVAAARRRLNDWLPGATVALVLAAGRGIWAEAWVCDAKLVDDPPEVASVSAPRSQILKRESMPTRRRASRS